MGGMYGSAENGLAQSSSHNHGSAENESLQDEFR